MSIKQVFLPVSAAVLMLAASAIAGARMIPDVEPAPADGIQAVSKGSYHHTDGVTSTLYLPFAAREFDPSEWLPPDHVLVSQYPRVTRLTQSLGDGETRVLHFVRNNLDHPVEHFALTFVAQAAAGAVQPVSITTDHPSLFALAQSDNPRVVTCTFAIRADQVLQANQRAELACTYRKDPGTIVVDSESVSPEPFVADRDYDQVHDRLSEIIATSGVTPIEVLVMLTRPVEQSDLELFGDFGGQIEYEIPLIDGFFGAMPADRIMDYRAAAVDIDFIEPSLPVNVDLDIATRNTRANRVWEGDTDGSAAATHQDEYAIDGDPQTAIAVVDSGMDATHPGLGPFQDVLTLPGGWGALPAGTKIVGWRDFDPRGAATPVDHNGHGSHVAGIAAGSGGGAPPGGRDVRGVAPGASLMGLRRPQMGWHSAAIANMLNWLRGQLNNYHVVVVNQSLGSGVQRDPSKGWARASQRIVEAGVVVVKSAGNGFDDADGGEIVSYPGALPKLLTVGAVNDADQITWYSSNGSSLWRVTKPDVVAPGGGWVIDNNFNFTPTMTSVDSNQLEPFLDIDGDNVHDPGDRCLDANRNDEFDTQMDIYLDRNANWMRDAGEPFNNWNGVPGFQAGGDVCRDTHAGPPANQLTGELWLDLNGNGAYDPNGRTPTRDDYTEKVGTSMAAPVVAGEVALVVDAMTDYAEDNTDDDRQGGAARTDEDRWDGIDNDDDQIIDEDPGQWEYDEQFARLVKSIVLMASFEVPGGEAVPPQWLWFDENGDGRRQFGADELIRDVNSDQTYDGGDAVVSQGANGVTDTPLGTDFSRNDADFRHDPWFQNAGDSNNPHMRDGNPDLDWDRGDKDNKEGYGRVAIDAAVEAVTNEFCAVATDQFGNGVTDKKVWARHLHLYRDKEYEAILEGPGGADYDLYLYRGIPDANGEPVIIKESTTPTSANETLTFEVPADGLYFLIVRRVTGAGEFTVRLVTPEEWTIMVYMPGELEGASDLDDLLFEALNDMEEIGSGEEDMKHFQVLALADYDERAYDGKDGPPPADEPDHRGDAVLYCVRRDHRDDQNQFSIAGQPADILTLTNPGQPNQRADANTGDPETLKKFAEWGVDHFPAKKYAVILWGDGRGYGWKTNPEKALGPGNDNKRAPGDAADANKDALTMQELREALKGVKSKINAGSQYKSGTGVDGTIPLVGFDMGHMGLLEVGRQIQESTEIMVASEESIHDRGWPYKEILDALTDNAQAWDAADFAKQIVSLYHTYYTITETYDIHTLSAVRLNPASEAGANKFQELVDETSGFAAQMLAVLDEPDRGTCEDEHDIVNDNVQYHIKHAARDGVQEFEDRNYVDLQHFASLIEGSPICPGDVTKDTQVISLTQKAGPVILAEEHGPDRGDAHGLSIYFPHDQFQPKDANCKYAPDRGTRLCGFDSPLPAKEVYAKDANILVPGLRQPPASDTHPRPQEDLRLPADTTWDEFLHRYYKPVADACVRVGSDCVKMAFGLVGTPWTLSGEGSSDSDGPNQDDTPVDWYWDKDPAVDNPAPMPAYPITATAPVDPACTEDCDRDAADEPDDDPDLVGSVVQWVCPVPGIFPFRLMTHDEHNDQNRDFDEEPHFVHWKLDDDELLIWCFWPIIIKTPDTVTPAPGDEVGYDVTITNNYPDDAGVDAAPAVDERYFHAVDKLPSAMALQPDSLTCQGECGFDAATAEITWTGSLASGESADMSYSVIIDDSIEITETTPVTLENTITTTLNGYVETATSVVTVTEEPCTPLTAVTIAADPTVVTGDPLTVTSAYEPPEASQPITYHWSSDWLIGGQGTATATYRFLEPGPVTLALEAANCDGTATAAATLDVFVTPRPVVTCTVTKSDFPDPVGPGDSLIYTIGIQNTGEVTATAVEAIEHFPAGLQVQWAEPEPTTELYTWELAALPPGESYTILIGTLVDLSVVPGTWLVNEVTVAAAEFPSITVTEETLVQGIAPGRLSNSLPP